MQSIDRQSAGSSCLCMLHWAMLTYFFIVQLFSIVNDQIKLA